MWRRKKDRSTRTIKGFVEYRKKLIAIQDIVMVESVDVVLDPDRIHRDDPHRVYIHLRTKTQLDPELFHDNEEKNEKLFMFSTHSKSTRDKLYKDIMEQLRLQ